MGEKNTRKTEHSKTIMTICSIHIGSIAYQGRCLTWPAIC